MLHFFRRYQRVFFILITFVIIVSFSFFGSYSAFQEPVREDPVAFKTLTGKEVYHQHFENMRRFLATDSTDFAVMGRKANFLNDGVIRKNFLENGLAEVTMDPYLKSLEGDLSRRLQHEKKYRPYAHPAAPFIGAENAWSFFAPDLKSNYAELVEEKDATSPAAFKARINLYLEQDKFTPELLRQVIALQEQRYEWIKEDPNLTNLDLSLFGYHTAEDWFGQRFLQLATRFVLEAAAQAEAEGLVVTNEEAQADLMAQAAWALNLEMSMPMNANKKAPSVANYLDGSLAYMGMDRNEAIGLWKQVLQFRRFLGKADNTVFVDPTAFKRLAEVADASVELAIYSLPEALHLSKAADLQRFEYYLNSVAEKRPEGSLELPTNFRPVKGVLMTHPELVQKRYLLGVSSISKEDLKARVGVKETWNWETDVANWKQLVKKFPVLEEGQTAPQNADERFAALSKLDRETRAKVDNIARQALVKAHPEWVAAALQEQPPEVKSYALRFGEGNTPFLGVKEPAELFALLDKAPLTNSQEIANGAEPIEELKAFSADNLHYYRIFVVARADKPELLTFEESLKAGALDKAIDKNAPQDKASNAQHRFDAAMKRYLDQIKTASPEEQQKLLQTQDEQEVGKLATRQPLANQWLLEKQERTVKRKQFKGNDTASGEALLKALAMEQGNWSSVVTTEQGEAFFYQVLSRGEEQEEIVRARTNEARALLSQEAERLLASQLTEKLQAAGAIVLTENIE
jgi:GcvH upstream region-like protein